MGEDITFSIFWGLVGFIFRLVTIDTILYITALSVLIAFSIINGYVMLGPPVSPQEYIVYKCSKFLIFINFIFFTITFIIHFLFFGV